MLDNIQNLQVEGLFCLFTGQMVLFTNWPEQSSQKLNIEKRQGIQGGERRGREQVNFVCLHGPTSVSSRGTAHFGTGPFTARVRETALRPADFNGLLLEWLSE